MAALPDLHEISQKLNAAGIENPRREAKSLLKAVLGWSDDIFITGNYPALSNAEEDNLNQALKRRCAREPLSKIVGRKSFWTHDFLTNEHVLDPRPDTEVLIEAVLAAYPDRDKHLRILDLGTGSGCIILTILSEYPNARGVAVDISAEALEVAQKNAQQLDVHDRAEFRQGSWFEPLDNGMVFDIVVSNPPYIETADIESLDEEVKNHDPILALDGGENGFDCYEAILKDLKKVIHPHGEEPSQIFFELGASQFGHITRLVKLYGFAMIHHEDDLSGITRVAQIALCAV